MDITYYYQQIINQSILNNKFRDVNTIIRSLDYLRILQESTQNKINNFDEIILEFNRLFTNFLQNNPQMCCNRSDINFEISKLQTHMLESYKRLKTVEQSAILESINMFKIHLEQNVYNLDNLPNHINLNTNQIMTIPSLGINVNNLNTLKQMQELYLLQNQLVNNNATLLLPSLIQHRNSLILPSINFNTNDSVNQKLFFNNITGNNISNVLMINQLEDNLLKSLDKKLASSGEEAHGYNDIINNNDIINTDMENCNFKANTEAVINIFKKEDDKTPLYVQEIKGIEENVYDDISDFPEEEVQIKDPNHLDNSETNDNPTNSVFEENIVLKEKFLEALKNSKTNKKHFQVVYMFKNKIKRMYRIDCMTRKINVNFYHFLRENKLNMGLTNELLDLVRNNIRFTSKNKFHHIEEKYPNFKKYYEEYLESDKFKNLIKNIKSKYDHEYVKLFFRHSMNFLNYYLN